jgi:hypothetical protein
LHVVTHPTHPALLRVVDAVLGLSPRDLPRA